MNQLPLVHGVIIAVLHECIIVEDTKYPVILQCEESANIYTEVRTEDDKWLHACELINVCSTKIGLVHFLVRQRNYIMCEVRRPNQRVSAISDYRFPAQVVRLVLQRRLWSPLFVPYKKFQHNLKAASHKADSQSRHGRFWRGYQRTFAAEVWDWMSYKLCSIRQSSWWFVVKGQ